MPSTPITCSILLNTCASEMCSDLSWYCTFVWCRSWGQGKSDKSDERGPGAVQFLGPIRPTQAL